MYLGYSVDRRFQPGNGPLGCLVGLVGERLRLGILWVLVCLTKTDWLSFGLHRKEQAMSKTLGEFMTQPKITGYRELTLAEAELMNDIKAAGIELHALVDRVRSHELVDQRWASIGATDLQTGLMALTRAVARPTTF